MNRFEIVSGTPTSEELTAISQAIAEHKRVIKEPFVKRSTWAQPQMRAAMSQAIKFGAGRNI